MLLEKEPASSLSPAQEVLAATSKLIPEGIQNDEVLLQLGDLSLRFRSMGEDDNSPLGIARIRSGNETILAARLPLKTGVHEVVACYSHTQEGLLEKTEVLSGEDKQKTLDRFISKLKAVTQQ